VDCEIQASSQDLRHQLGTMHLHYRFVHACGHTGIGPLIYDASNRRPSLFLNDIGSEKLTTVHLELTFSCPFCFDRGSNFGSTIPEVPLSHGILTIISPTYPWNWSIIKICRYEDVTPQDWAHSISENMVFRQMAWIPKPCGEVRITGGLDEVRREGLIESGVITEVACAWRQMANDPVATRFAGLLTQFNAAGLSTERAGR
jgi:hypothetical protein